MLELIEVMQLLESLTSESSPEEIVEAFERFNTYCESTDISDPDLLLEMNLLLSEGEELIKAFKNDY